jgi:phosphoribosylglycinamide formyltransferase-1
MDAVAGSSLPGVAIALVLSDRSCPALARAEAAAIPTALVDRRNYPRNSEIFSSEVLRELEAAGCVDLVVLAGFLSILRGAILARFRDRIINVHPSLIPSFAGDGCWGIHVHEQALARGVKVTGVTVHFVDEVTDGGRILLQEAVPVLEGDSPESLQARVLEVEHLIIVEAVALLTKEEE